MLRGLSDVQLVSGRMAANEVQHRFADRTGDDGRIRGRRGVRERQPLPGRIERDPPEHRERATAAFDGPMIGLMLLAVGERRFAVGEQPNLHRAAADLADACPIDIGEDAGGRGAVDADPPPVRGPGCRRRSKKHKHGQPAQDHTAPSSGPLERSARANIDDGVKNINLCPARIPHGIEAAVCPMFRRSSPPGLAPPIENPASLVEHTRRAIRSGGVRSPIRWRRP